MKMHSAAITFALCSALSLLLMTCIWAPEEVSAQRLKSAFAAVQYPSLDGKGVSSPCNAKLGAANEIYRRLLPRTSPSSNYARAAMRGITIPILSWERNINKANRNLPTSLVVQLSQLAGHDLARSDPLVRGQDYDAYNSAGGTLSYTNVNSKTVDGIPSILNLHSSFLHLSGIYGKSLEECSGKRKNKDGKMMLDINGLLITKSKVYCFSNDSPFPAFLGNPDGYYGDIFDSPDLRVNFNTPITTISHLFFREHNRRAEELKKKHPCATDEELFNEARRWNIAIWQNIYFNQVLPLILHGPLPPYTGFKPNTDSRVSLFDAFVALRWGEAVTPDVHSVLNFDSTSGTFGLTENVCPMAVYSPADACIQKMDVSDIILGMSAIQGGTATTYHSSLTADGMAYNPDTIPNRPSSYKFDLLTSALSLSRQFDLPSYNQYRKYFNLKEISAFTELDITSEQATVLSEKYPGAVASLDAKIGALLEPRPKGKFFGPLINAALTRLFTAVRDADRFYFESSGSRFTCVELAEIRATTIEALLKRHSAKKYTIPDDMLSKEISLSSLVPAPNSKSCQKHFGCFN